MDVTEMSYDIYIVCVFVLTASCVDVSLAPGNRPVWMC